jgi:CysZ protein
MITLLPAITMALRDIIRPGMLWHVLWPPLASVFFWVIAGALLWPYGMQLMDTLLPTLPWSGWEWISQWAGGFLLIVLLLMLIYLTTIMLVAMVALPLMVNKIALQDYPDLSRHGEQVFWRSLRNTLVAGGIFLVGGLCALPLLIIPGVILVLPFLGTMWLNQRTFRFDVLAEHATEAELRQIVHTHRSAFYAAGGTGAAVAYIPIVQLVAPVLTALIFVHVALVALRQMRQQQGVQL